MVTFLNQKAHLHTAYHQTLKRPQELPEVSNVGFRTIFQKAPTLHFLLNK